MGQVINKSLFEHRKEMDAAAEPPIIPDSPDVLGIRWGLAGEWRESFTLAFRAEQWKQNAKELEEIQTRIRVRIIGLCMALDWVGSGQVKRFQAV